MDLERIAEALARPREGWDVSGREPSAVAVPLVERESGIEIWIIRRPATMRLHAGEFAFPGGKRDDADATLLDTALREMHEELGVARDKTRLLGSLSAVPVATSRFAIHPFAIAVDASISPVLAPAEVAELVRAPLASFFDGTIGYATVDMKTYVSPIFRFGDRIMYGASAHILQELLEHCGTLPKPDRVDKAPWL
jgi:8-oxo-dGTP pyrophosphatase MutT (NUDIX family)